jgi:glycoside/pentoside/hexuronide:cation symporter, GPH family
MTTAPAQHQIAASDRIPWNQLIAFGMGGLIPIALFNIAGQLMGLLGNISLGLSAFWLGVIMIIPRLWDAVSDPIAGHLSDNTRTRWGRRRPFILVGALAVAVSFVGMWWVPRGPAVQSFFGGATAYNWFQLAFILLGLLIFFTATNVFEIPHGALGLEMSLDSHERTRLFSAKSFLGNLFAMGTPWLIALASLDFFRGPGGDLVDGMRYVSMFIGIVLIPLAFWWFFALREPGFEVARKQQKSEFWRDMGATITNRTFLQLTAIVFVLAMGFNFVALFNYYISIFYLYAGNEGAAGRLLGINGTIWAITGLVAVFPLNWVSKRVGKSQTLFISILLMCAAQLSKIVCYNPALPYLVVIPTVLLSAGMLMFFTLGSSMVGDICDDDELRTGTRSEGKYYAIFWWFIKMGSAFASFVTGALLIVTMFDEQQNVGVDALRGALAVIKSEAPGWEEQGVDTAARLAKFDEQIAKANTEADQLRTHFAERVTAHPATAAHSRMLGEAVRAVQASLDALQASRAALVSTPPELVSRIERVLQQSTALKQQSPATLFRLRLIEIGTPLLLSILSIVLTLTYPLTEARCHEIKEALKRRRASAAEQAAVSS